MSLELTTLRLLKYRERCERLYRVVPKQVLDTKTQTILDDFVAYFKEFPEAKRVSHDEFFMWFRAFRHPTLTDEQAKLYEHMLRAVQEDVSAELESGLMARLMSAESAYNMAEHIQRFQNGEDVDLYVLMRDEVEKFEAGTDRKVKVPWVQTPIGEMLAEEENDTGLHWRWDCLNLSMRPLRGGDFVVVAGRPDKGKTTAISDNATHMSKQVYDMFAGERDVLWMNNEGPGRRIKQRCYQSALNVTIPEMVELYNKPSTKGYAHLLDELYADAVGGIDRIKIMDIHDFSSHEVEDILRRMPCGLLILDMVDNIKFGGSAINGGERTDQLLEAMYQWARMLAVKWDIPIVATSQISNDGDGMQYPTLGMLKDSKTGKQGAAEAIITLGASNDQMLANSRFIGSTKNKLHRYGGPKDPRCEMTFDGERGRYSMPRSL